MAWETKSAMAMLHLGQGKKRDVVRNIACTVPPKKCSPRDAEPSFGTNHFVPPAAPQEPSLDGKFETQPYI